MFSHRQVWAAIDALAQNNDMSVSRLARNAGLDPTTFNKSKRLAADGRERWPSTESLAKIMTATNTRVDEFTQLMIENAQEFSKGIVRLKQLDAVPPIYHVPQSVPIVGMAQAGTGGYFDDGGFPAGQGWDEVNFPRTNQDNVYALEITGDSMLPLYRDGDTIIVSPGAAVRRGDRVVVKTLDGEVMAKVLARKTDRVVELMSVNPEHENPVFNLNEVEWVARIVWASQ